MSDSDTSQEEGFDSSQNVHKHGQDNRSENEVVYSFEDFISLMDKLEWPGDSKSSFLWLLQRKNDYYSNPLDTEVITPMINNEVFQVNVPRSLYRDLIAVDSVKKVLEVIKENTKREFKNVLDKNGKNRFIGGKQYYEKKDLTNAGRCFKEYNDSPLSWESLLLGIKTFNIKDFEDILNEPAKEEKEEEGKEKKYCASEAFRKLKEKTQLFPFGEEGVRDRQKHSEECAQIGEVLFKDSKISSRNRVFQ